MNIAQGSLEECRYYFILAKDLKYIQLDGELKKIEVIAKLLSAYSKAILNSDS